MTLDEIKAAVERGDTVHWSNTLYRVIHDSVGQWLIICDANQSCIGLTWMDGVTMNGEPEQFFIATRVPCPNDCTRFGGKVPGHIYGSNWPWVPCQTCMGTMFVDVEPKRPDTEYDRIVRAEQRMNP